MKMTNTTPEPTKSDPRGTPVALRSSPSCCAVGKSAPTRINPTTNPSIVLINVRILIFIFVVVPHELFIMVSDSIS